MVWLSCTLTGCPSHHARPRSSLLSLLDGELGGGIGLEPGIGDGKPAADREPEGSVLETTLGPIEGSQPFTQTGRDGVVALLGGEALGGIGHIPGFVGRGSVVAAG